MKNYCAFSIMPILIVGLMFAPPRAKRSSRQAATSPQTEALRTGVQVQGQSKTLMPDGHWLLLGGEGLKGVLGAAATEDPATGAITSIASGLAHPRAWHTATLLPNGTVLIFGGVGTDGHVVTTAEVFNPATKQFNSINTSGLIPRARHTATLLTDGSVLIVGGVSENGDTLSTAELWNWQSSVDTGLSAGLITARRDHTATLLRDGEVLFWGGQDRNGSLINYGEVYDPGTLTFRIETTPLQVSNDLPFVEQSIPADTSNDVSVSTLIVVRFSKPMLMTSVNATTVTLSDSSGLVGASVVPAEGGMLEFVTPQSPLLAGTSYTLALTGLTDQAENPLRPTVVDFTTAGSTNMGLLGTGNGTGGNQSVDSQTQNLSPLQAPHGVTALSGQSLKLNGAPLKDLTVKDETSGVKAETDGTGRFLLMPLRVGHHVLFVDGRTASGAQQVYGTYEIGVDIVGGKTNVLNYKIWMTPLDTVHAVRIPSPTTSDMVISNPSLPGLELHLPKGTVITDHEGNVVHEVSITPIPLTQPPFPLPQGVRVPIYFTIQPGAAYLSVNGGSGPQGAQLYYPNTGKASPGTPTDFWNYDPDVKGWYVYGHGKVGLDDKQIVPDPGLVIYEFTGAMVANPSFGGGGGGAGGGTASGGGCGGGGTPPGGPNKSAQASGGCAGEPVNLSNGAFIYSKTDLLIPDILPVLLTRTYRPNDSISRAFGVGTTHPFDIFLVGDNFHYTYAELILPDGGRIRFNRISPGDLWTDAVYVHTSTTTMYYGAVMTWNGSGWNITLRNGTVYVFPDGSVASRAQQAAIIGIRDRYGNIVSFNRDGNSNLTQLTTSNGRWIKFTYDSSNRITQAQDNINRTVSYSYDSSGRLSTVTDAKGGTTIYTYDSNSNMLTITDPRGITYLTNHYDSNNRVIAQTTADGSTFHFSYSPTGNSSLTHFVNLPSNYTGAGPGLDIVGFRNCQGCLEGYAAEISQVDVTDQRGVVRRVTFGPTGYITTDVRALGQPEEQTTTYQYYPDNLLKSVTDSLGRTTSYVYDLTNDVTRLTQLTGTSNAITSKLTYEPVHNEMTSVTDPLGHTTTLSYDANGNMVTVVDPLLQESSFTYNSVGQTLTATDALGNKTTFGYDSGDLVSITDPLNRTTTRFLDGAGRVVTVTNSLGQSTRTDYDALNEITKLTDPAGNVTNFMYDGNGNSLSLTDANSNATTYTYDGMDRLLTRTDPLSNIERYQYDAAGNLSQFTDRRGKIAAFTYDSLNRETLAQFGLPNSYDSSVSISYDKGNRPTSVVDSSVGTITPTFDSFSRLISVQTPQGTVSYSYDSVGRRTQMTVAGQAAVNYAYDNDSRLLQITQGSSMVSVGYDGANRSTSLTLPNGIVMSYSYDNASQLTGITYTNGGTTLGTLTYGYDTAGRRTQMGGSLAQTALPLDVNNATYNADNQLTEWGTAGLFYDANGNMLSDGVNSYAWDSRNRLASMNSGANSFQYDALGRRTSKTISATTTNFLYDGPNVVQELSGSTPTANLLTGGIDQIFTRTDSSGTANFLTDALGSTLALTNSSGSALAQYAYDPFGNTVVTSGSSSNSNEYTGRENDGAGLYFYRARYYNPSLQRFISEDPIGFDGGQADLYAYVGDSPLNSVDPNGMDGAFCGWADGRAIFCVTTTTTAGRKDAPQLSSEGDSGGLQPPEAPPASPPPVSVPGGVPNTPIICGGTFAFGGPEGDGALAGGFAGGIVEADSVDGFSGGSLAEGWVGGEFAAGGTGKISSKSSSGVLQGWFGFFGASISAGPLAGMQVGVASGKGWRGLYLEGHVGPVAFGTGGYLRSSCKAGG